MKVLQKNNPVELFLFRYIKSWLKLMVFFSYQELAATEMTASPIQELVTGQKLNNKISFTLTSIPTSAHTFHSNMQPDIVLVSIKVTL